MSWFITNQVSAAKSETPQKRRRTINRGLDDSLRLRRAHSLGHRRQLLNLLGYALMVNSLALARHEHAEPLAA